jgi:2-oxo-3-hexenedioate decarboxylase
VQPRLEPEIVFGFARAPEPGMDEAALVGCIDWVAHGLEIVHTHVGWRFDGPAAPVADFGLHGRLIVGPRRRLADWTHPTADRTGGIDPDAAPWRRTARQRPRRQRARRAA